MKKLCILLVIMMIVIIIWAYETESYNNKTADFSINVPSGWVEDEENTDFSYTLATEDGYNSFNIIFQDAYDEGIYDSRTELSLSAFDEEMRGIFLSATVENMEITTPSMEIIDTGFVELDIPMMYMEYNYEEYDEQYICSQFMALENGYMYILTFLGTGDDFDEDIKDLFTDMILSFELD